MEYFDWTSSVFHSVPYPVTCTTRGADLTQDTVVVLCPPQCTQWRMSVFGTGVYAAVSSICGAAVHRYSFPFISAVPKYVLITYYSKY